MRRRQPGLVGGEPADLILSTVRSFPLSLDYSGQIVLHNTARGEAAASLRRAYERVELEVLVLQERCAHKAAHGTMSPAEYHWMIMTDLMIEARVAAGDFERVDALWWFKLGTSVLHSGPRLDLGPGEHRSHRAPR
jgi:hypothetical protein